MLFDYSQVGARWIEGNRAALVGRVAFVPLEGLFQFGGTDLTLQYFGGLSTSRVVSLLSSLAQNASVDAVALEIDSPGGSSLGVNDIAHAFAVLRAAGKKIYAIAHDRAASLAMLPLCLADESIATPTAILGAMGARAGYPYIDFSEADAKDGIKRFNPAFPEGKAQGMGGAFSEEFMKAENAVSENVCRVYMGLIAANRNVSVDSLISLNAMVLTPDAAKAANLIDRVETFPAFITRVLKTHGTTLETPMSDPTPKSYSTVAELDAAFPGLLAQVREAAANLARESAKAAGLAPASFADLESRFSSDPAFVVQAQKKQMTMTQAIEAHAASLADQVKTLQSEITELKSKLAEATKGTAGVPASQTPGGAPGTPPNFEAAVQLCMVEANGSHSKAMLLANAKWPHLTESMFAGIREKGGVVR